MRSVFPKRNPGSCFGHQVSQSAEVVSGAGEGEQPLGFVARVVCQTLKPSRRLLLRLHEFPRPVLANA